MTREEAIKVLKKIKRVAERARSEDVKAYNMAIKALVPEPCEDAISREAVLSKIKEVCFSKEWLQFRVDKGSNGQRDLLIDFIKSLPPITPQPKTGHWIKVSRGTLCSICGCYAIDEEDGGLVILTDYCPWCGAKMEAEE